MRLPQMISRVTGNVTHEIEFLAVGSIRLDLRKRTQLVRSILAFDEPAKPTRVRLSAVSAMDEAPRKQGWTNAVPALRLQMVDPRCARDRLN